MIRRSDGGWPLPRATNSRRSVSQWSRSLRHRYATCAFYAATALFDGLRLYYEWLWWLRCIILLLSFIYDDTYRYGSYWCYSYKCNCCSSCSSCCCCCCYVPQSSCRNVWDETVWEKWLVGILRWVDCTVRADEDIVWWIPLMVDVKLWLLFVVVFVDIGALCFVERATFYAFARARCAYVELRSAGVSEYFDKRFVVFDFYYNGLIALNPCCESYGSILLRIIC